MLHCQKAAYYPVHIFKSSTFHYNFEVSHVPVNFHIPTYTFSLHMTKMQKKKKEKKGDSMYQQCYCRVTICFIRKPQGRENTELCLIPSPHTCCTVEDAIVKLLTERTLFLCFFLTTVNAYIELEKPELCTLCCSIT